MSSLPATELGVHQIAYVFLLGRLCELLVPVQDPVARHKLGFFPAHFSVHEVIPCAHGQVSFVRPRILFRSFLGRERFQLFEGAAGRRFVRRLVVGAVVVSRGLVLLRRGDLFL